MGSGELWLAGMPSLAGTFHQDPSNPLFSPYFLFPFPPPILQLPFNGDTGSPPSLLLPAGQRECGVKFRQ